MYSPDELDNLRAEANEDGADDEDFWADVPFATEAEALDAIRKQGEKV